MAELLFGWRLYLGTGLAFVGGALSGAVGIGGGGIYVPVLILIVGYTAKEAIPLSKVTVAGVAISSFLVNVLRRHPRAPWRALVDYDVAMVMTPTTLLGTTVGVLVYVILPEWLILILLILVLGLVDYRTFVAAIKLWKKEKVAKEAERQNRVMTVNPTADSIDRGVDMPGGADGGSGGHHHPTAFPYGKESLGVAHAKGLAHSLHGAVSSSVNDDNDITPEQEALLDKEAQQPVVRYFNNVEKSKSKSKGGGGGGIVVLNKPETCMPLWCYDAVKFLYLAIVWCIMFAIVFVRGGGESDESYLGIVKCSMYFWILWGVMFPIMLGFMVLSCIIARLIYSYRKRNGWPFIEGDVQWSVKSLFLIPFAGTIGGTAAGFLGIGSGMVNGPVMLEIGMTPEVATATSSFIIVFTALSTVSQYFIIGALNWQPALWFFVLGVLAAVVGQYGVQYVVKRFNKSSIISFLLAFVIAGSGVAMIVTGALQIADEGITGFADLCELNHHNATHNATAAFYH
ncbi:uncharacterized protein ACA1_184090 [Acanthamoeba castellanii str. Neff]|uniref:Sulfite exporter TauE/SafE n=1 Tax=Acanthamoeba castellanii (strain ATCC 30010 / Neff) TaxID=1257118 RepID=L8H9R2_ACACF|nr:uncharacterized protein ACA1_184090 [Acanthamoeba castellanii str. Neff]ELR21463.1 hypothetical protein ACA1_184090 [Acanthamoeba castellanii str. Neff]